jgi:hypothetical protein
VPGDRSRFAPCRATGPRLCRTGRRVPGCGITGPVLVGAHRSSSELTGPRWSSPVLVGAHCRPAGLSSSTRTPRRHPMSPRRRGPPFGPVGAAVCRGGWQGQQGGPPSGRAKGRSQGQQGRAPSGRAGGRSNEEQRCKARFRAYLRNYLRQQALIGSLARQHPCWAPGRAPCRHRFERGQRRMPVFRGHNVAL